MMLKPVLVLGITAILASAAPVGSAFARDGGRHHMTHDGDGDRSRVSEVPTGSYGYEHNDPWGHWGSYYGPLVH